LNNNISDLFAQLTDADHFSCTLASTYFGRHNQQPKLGKEQLTILIS